MTEINVFESEHLRVTCYDADHPRLIVSFDNWRKGRRGFPDPNPSQFFAKRNIAFVTVYSARNDWFLSPDTEAAKQALSQFSKAYDHITSIGFSMGGYGTLLFSRATRTNQVVLVSPQCSIFPARAPFEDRYLQEAAQLDPSLDTLSASPRKGLRGVLLFDPTVMQDRQHAAILTRLYPKITPVPLPFGGHPAMQTIAQAKLYSQVQQELLQRRVRPREFLRIHKQARLSAPLYQDRMTHYLAQRSTRIPKT